MNIFEAIKSKSLDQLKEVIAKNNINSKDQYGRTPLHYAIVQKAPIELFKELIDCGADINIEDKSHETVIYKAIKFENKQAIQILIDNGVELNHPLGIKYTPWFSARHLPEIADLMLKTQGAVRLTLTKEEKDIIDKLLYLDEKNLEHNLERLNTPELLHAFVLNFNWDDDITPIDKILHNSLCKEITAIEMFELADGHYWLEHPNVKYKDDEQYVKLINDILERFPQVLR
ncbi:DUF4274 domain-containing protein [Clostridium coskatii]|uniref:Ankyrin repeats (3 copies) n=1 Tax=Clostridium coskatii TaxID=1705578 RepID=A0A168PC33_9CLOT|nr:DUF4274 domain-containing protein [Clostridium coskatii]OAA87559.1 Ankyrin repeats (3 copies) [Clostridium coskatii]OBR96459.1 ankyrin repeats (3 copies) [Clostridium coskatii]